MIQKYDPLYPHAKSLLDWGIDPGQGVVPPKKKTTKHTFLNGCGWAPLEFKMVEPSFYVYKKTQKTPVFLILVRKPSGNQSG